MADMCTDGRFEIIAKAKEKLIHYTNITEEELKVADEFLYRCWQMGWLESECDYEIKEYDVGNGKKLLVNYNDSGIARITKPCIEQVLIPIFEKDEKYSWHDLRKNPEDLPENENYVIAKIKFYGKGSERYKSNCYTSGVYEQRPERWNLEQGHKWHDEYNPFVDYEVIKWKYIDEEVEE